MPKRSTPIKNPDQEVDASTFDVVRKVTGGETPAEALARAEAEQRRRPTRILDLLEGFYLAPATRATSSA